jgi:hypothetical protein
MSPDFDKCHYLSKRNVKLILKILSDLEPLRGSSNKKTLYSTRSCVNWSFFGTRGPKKPNLHMYSLNNSILLYELHKTVYCRTRGFGARRTQ